MKKTILSAIVLAVIATSAIAGDKAAVFQSGGKFYVIPLKDVTLPVRSNGQPTGTLPAGTTTTDLTIVTDEDAECRYAPNAAMLNFNTMSPFNSTDTTLHNTLITGLINGGAYNYAVRCQDTSGNTNQDNYNVSFSVAVGGDGAPQRFNGQPTGVLESSTTETMLSLNTDVNAECRYAPTWPDLSFETMKPFNATNATFHYQQIAVQQDVEPYSYSVRCKNSKTGATNQDNYNIVFYVGDDGGSDCGGPVRSNGVPGGVELDAGTTEVTMSVNTDVNADCRYNLNADSNNPSNIDFDDMRSTFQNTGGLLHFEDITGLEDGKHYTYSIRCKDKATGATNDCNYNIPFSVAEAQQ